MFMVSNLVRTAAAVLATTLAILLAGCVFVPYQSAREELPDVVSKLPDRLRSSNDEVLVLGQYSRSKKYAPLRTPSVIVSAPVFLKAKELNAVNQTLKLESDLKQFNASIWIWPPVIAGVDTTGREHLVKLCVLAPDGLSITFWPGGVEWSSTRRELLYANRRDAIIVALRDGSAS